jgi:hypothetical protein
MAQTGAPVRTIGTSEPMVGSTALIGERKAAPCAEKSCAGKPLKRSYVGAPSLGW